MTEPSEQTTEQWSIVELMGHRQLAGRVSEIQRYGTTMMRIDVPQKDGSMVTQFYGGAAVYSETPSTKETVVNWLSDRYGWNEVRQLSLPEGTRAWNTSTPPEPAIHKGIEVITRERLGWPKEVWSLEATEAWYYDETGGKYMSEEVPRVFAGWRPMKETGIGESSHE